MYLSSIKLCNFRNFKELCFQPEPGINLLMGRNAQGKTNLIEAVNFLGCGSSFRTSQHQDLVCWGEKEGSVTARVCLSVGESVFSIVVSEHGRRGFINGQAVRSLKDFIGRILCVSFSPTDLSLIKGSPEGRRIFMDRHLTDLDPSFMTTLALYYRALQHKRRLLRSGITRKEEYLPWHKILAPAAVEIGRKRRRFLNELMDRAGLIIKAIGGEAEGALLLRLKSNFSKEDTTLNADDAEEFLQSNLSREIAAQACIFGTHRDDMEIMMGGRNTQIFASQGQARSLVLALKLGVIELIEGMRAETPIILLDDVFSELDSEREKALLSMILERNRQVFITGTSLSTELKGAAKQCRVWRVEDGGVW